MITCFTRQTRYNVPWINHDGVTLYLVIPLDSGLYQFIIKDNFSIWSGKKKSRRWIKNKFSGISKISGKYIYNISGFWEISLEEDWLKFILRKDEKQKGHTVIFRPVSSDI